MRRGAADRPEWRYASAGVTARLAGAAVAIAAALAACATTARAAQVANAQRFDGGRVTVVAFPRDAALARSLVRGAMAQDSFPGLPRPRAAVTIAIAPDRERFRRWVGDAAPEWGAAIAFPGEQRIVMQGSWAGSEVGDPVTVLRHELAHLALHEFLADRPPRWFDEGYASYAAGEWGRDAILATSWALAVRGTPSLDEVEADFQGGGRRAESAYALAHRAVVELAELGGARGLAPLMHHWRTAPTFDAAVRRAYGVTALGFERHWQRVTRRRYGALALLTDLGAATAVLLLLLIPLYVRRRRRDRARLRALRRADDEQERIERESAIDVLLDTLPPRDDSRARDG